MTSEATKEPGVHSGIPTPPAQSLHSLQGRRMEQVENLGDLSIP